MLLSPMLPREKTNQRRSARSGLAPPRPKERIPCPPGHSQTGPTAGSDAGPAAQSSLGQRATFTEHG